MTRHAKLTVAAIATALLATFGVAGASSTSAAPMYKDRGWCC
ncbi:MAG TPA: hypothetical protein VD814_06840 [Nocardioides sp.]|nr:hypothetical protein [Nocardioides sp.]